MKLLFFLIIVYVIKTSNSDKYFSATTPRDAVWQPVVDTSDKIYVYSAYADWRLFDHIRIIAVKHRIMYTDFLCRIWTLDKKNFTVRATVESMKEHHRKKYTSSFVICHLKEIGIKAIETIGGSVSVISALFPTRPHTNKLLILDTKPNPKKLNDIYLCVQPVHSQFFRPNWLIEWLEINLLLGIKKIYIYKESVDNRTDCMLRDYQKKGYVKYLNWGIPVLKENIWVYGQIATNNDCLYRSMSKSGWLLSIDIDELVLPRVQFDFKELLRDYQETFNALNSSKALGEIVFRNVFFYLGWEDAYNAPADLITSKKTRRLSQPYPNRNRSKFIVRPYEVIQLMIHYSMKLMPNATSTDSSIERAILHHYRESCVENNCLDLPSEIDTTAHRWSTDLIQRVQQKKKFLAEICFNHTQIEF